MKFEGAYINIIINLGMAEQASRSTEAGGGIRIECSLRQRATNEIIA
jgi:hypothetical protein